MMKIQLFLLLLFVLPFVSAGEETYTFRIPDIRDDFCGAEMDFRYCRCAFHNDYCDILDTTRSSARSYVDSEFWSYVKEGKEAWARNCLETDGIYLRSKNQCTHCTDGYVKDAGRCMEPDAPEDVAERYGLRDDLSLPKAENGRLEGRIVDPNGEVFVYSNAFEKWIGPIENNYPVYTGDFVHTTSYGSTKVVMFTQDSEEVVTMDTDTSFEIRNRQTPEEESWPVYLRNGVIRIYNTIREEMSGEPRRENPFNVRTPTVVASARGTDFIVRYDDTTGISEVILYEGIVDVYEPGGTPRTLQEGEVAMHDGTFSYETLDDERWIAMLDTYDFKQERYVLTKQDLNRSPAEPIDPDAVVPREIAITGDFAGDIAQEKKGFPWALLGLVLVAGGGAYLYARRKV